MAAFTDGLDPMIPGLATFNPGLTDFRPGLDDFRPGLVDFNPGLKDLSPGLVDLRPGLEDFRLGLVHLVSSTAWISNALGGRLLILFIMSCILMTSKHNQLFSQLATCQLNMIV
nr:unnamed protein product [Callosobruchus chinensis]